MWRLLSSKPRVFSLQFLSSRSIVSSSWKPMTWYPIHFGLAMAPSNTRCLPCDINRRSFSSTAAVWKKMPWNANKTIKVPHMIPGLPAPVLKKHRLSKKPYLARNKRDQQVAAIRQSAAERWIISAKGNLKRLQSGTGHRAHSKSKNQSMRLRRKVYATRTQLRKLRKILPQEMATRLRR